MIYPGLNLDCFYENDSTEALSELDLPDTALTNYDVRTMKFYSISAIGKYVDYKDDNEKEYGIIYAGDTSFVTTITPGELEFMVEKWIKTYYDERNKKTA